MGQEREVNLPQLFSDVSRTVSGIRNILGAESSGPSMAEAAGEAAGAAGRSGLLDNVCFKACGMEDIQFAARSAGEMLITMRMCLLIGTIVSVMCLVALTATAVYLVCRRNPPGPMKLPHLINDLFPSSKQTSKDDSQ